MEDDGFTPEEDMVLYRMVAEPEHRALLAGDHNDSSQWTLIAQQLKKTVRAVERRFLELTKEADDDRLDLDIDIGSPETRLENAEARGGNVGYKNTPGNDARPTPPGVAQSNERHGQETASQPQIQMQAGTGQAGAGQDSNPAGTTTQNATTNPKRPKESSRAPRVRNGLVESNDRFGAGEKTGKFWSDEETIHLLLLGRDEEYRQMLTGNQAIDWAAIGKCLGRGARAAKRKFDNLQDVELAPSSSGNGHVLVYPPNEKKKWSDEEVIELLQLGDPSNTAFREEKIGISHIDWLAIARYFGRSRDTVAYKFKYEELSSQGNIERNALMHGVGTDGANGRSGSEGIQGLDPSGRPGSGDCQGSSAYIHPTQNAGTINSRNFGREPRTVSYKSMTASAFFKVNPTSLEATGGQICDYIESNLEYGQELDRTIMPGKKSTPRWKHGIRSALYKYPFFIKTNRKAGGEVIWQLDAEGLEAAKSRQEEKERVARINKAAKDERKRTAMAKCIVAEHEKILAIQEAVRNKRLRTASKALKQTNGQPDDEHRNKPGSDVRMHIGSHGHEMRGPVPPMPVRNSGTGGTGLPPLDPAEAGKLSSPITLQQIIDQSMTADQLAQLTPEQLSDLQHQLNTGLAAANVPPQHVAPPTMAAPNPMATTDHQGAHVHQYPPQHGVHPMQAYMGFYDGGMPPPTDQGMMMQGQYGVAFQPQEGAPMGMYMHGGPYQHYEGPPGGYGGVGAMPPNHGNE